MHAHQPQSQICKTRKLPALREVKHPHKGRTSVSRFPLAKQGISSQDSGYIEGIGHFTRDPCKFHLKSDLQQARHESEEVNTENVNTHWVHSLQDGTCQTFPSTYGNVHGRPPHSDHRENPMTPPSRHWTCRIPTRHGKYTSLSRKPVPTGK